MGKFHIHTQIYWGNALFSGKNYTVGNSFTRPPVMTVATNFKSVLALCQTKPSWSLTKISKLWNFCFALKVLNESKYSMPWVCFAFGNVWYPNWAQKGWGLHLVKCFQILVVIKKRLRCSDSDIIPASGHSPHTTVPLCLFCFKPTSLEQIEGVWSHTLIMTLINSDDEKESMLWQWYNTS